MTVSAHAYAATLQPGTPLRGVGGSITLDESTAPHVQGTITIAAPPLAILAALDPRQSPPPRITVAATAVFPWATQARTFDLTLRERRVRHADGVVELVLSSDEGLLSDISAAEDDAAPFALASSLRAVVNYVLGKVIPGASLASSADADITPCWSLTNYITNPRAETTTGFYTGGNVSTWGLDTTSGAAVGSNYVWWRSTAAGWSDMFLPGTATAREGEAWTASAKVRSDIAGHSMRVVVQFINANGAICGQALGASVAAPAAPGWATAFASGEAPAGTVRVQAAVTHLATGGGQAVGLDAPMLVEGSRLVPHFHGGSVGGGYAYAWQGDADASASTRTPLVERDPDSLTWKAGQSALEFLAPLVQASGRRLVCDEARVWTLRGEEYTADGAIAIRHAVNLIGADDKIGRDDALWFDGAVVRYTWTDATGKRQERIDSFALTGTPSRVVLIERATPYPGPGFAAYAVRRAQGRGREVSATTVADWNARAEQAVQIVLDGAPVQIGKTSRVVFDLDRDEMTVTTRTTDTPAGAVDLLPGTIDALVGTIDSL